MGTMSAKRKRPGLPDFPQSKGIVPGDNALPFEPAKRKNAEDGGSVEETQGFARLASEEKGTGKC